MIPGPYAICWIEPIEENEGASFHTLCWGYCSAAEALAAIDKIAAENERSADECYVVRVIENHEAERFVD